MNGTNGFAEHMLKLKAATEEIRVTYSAAQDERGSYLCVKGAIGDVQGTFVDIDGTHWKITGTLYNRETHQEIRSMREMEYIFCNRVDVILRAQAGVSVLTTQVNLGNFDVMDITNRHGERGFMHLKRKHW